MPPPMRLPPKLDTKTPCSLWFMASQIVWVAQEECNIPNATQKAVDSFQKRIYEHLLQEMGNSWPNNHIRGLNNERLKELVHTAISAHSQWWVDGAAECVTWCTGDYVNIDGAKCADYMFATIFGFLLSFVIAVVLAADAFNHNATLDPIAKVFVTIAILMALATAFIYQKGLKTIKKSLSGKAQEITCKLLKWGQIPFKQPAVDQMQKIVFMALEAAAANRWNHSIAVIVAKYRIKKFHLENHMWEKLIREACKNHKKWHDGVIYSAKKDVVNIQKEAIFKLLRTLLWMFMILLVLDVVFPIGQKDALTAAAVLVIGAVVVAPLIYFKTRPRRTS